MFLQFFDNEVELIFVVNRDKSRADRLGHDKVWLSRKNNENGDGAVIS
jgi:hypothetical protein